LAIVAIAVGMAIYGMYEKENMLWLAGLQSIILPAMLSIILGKKIKTNSSSKRLLVWFLVFAMASFVAETYYVVDDMYWMTDQFPSIADGLWLTGYAGLIIFTWKNFEYLQKMISKKLVFFALGIASTSLIPTMLIVQQLGYENILELTTALSYPILDVVIMIPLVLGTIVFIKMKNTAWITLLLAMSAFTVGDLIYPYYELNDTYTTGHPIDMAWLTGYLLFIIAAITFDEKKMNWLSIVKPNNIDIKFDNVYKITIPLMLGAIFLVAITTIYQLHEFGDNGFFESESAIYWIIGMMSAFTGVILTINHNLTKMVKSRTEQLAKEAQILEVQIKEKNNLINLQIKLEQEIEARNKDLLKKSLQLEEQNKKLMEIDKRKAEFASMVTHELKTPLTPILSWCDILMHYNSLDTLNEKQKNAVTKV
jgi:hypothetical protein